MKYDYQHNTTISVQQFIFTTTVTRHSHSLGQGRHLGELGGLRTPRIFYTISPL